MPDFALTYLQLRTAIQERRFPSNSPFDQWLQAAYVDVWSSGDWTFKRISREPWTVSSAKPTMPPAFSGIIGLLDDQGYPLEEVDQRDFERVYTETPAVTGRPTVFTVVNRGVTLHPAPASTYTFSISYTRRIATRTAAGAVQAGFFVADSDIPLWDDHHYLLVLRAKILGLRDRSDPTATDLTSEYQGLLEAMRDEYSEPSPVGMQIGAYRP